MTFLGTETQLKMLASPSRAHSDPAARLWGRQMDRQHFANLDLLRGKSVRYPFGDKQTQTIFIDML
jgi:hypothetical protein